MKRCPNCQTEYADTFKVCPQDGGRLTDETVVLEAPTVAGVTMPVGDPMLGRTIAGRFRIEKKLGEGGMGAVYKAEHVKMNRPCAIKILNESALNDPEALPRFNREAQMSSRIDHPNAVTIYDYGESEDGLVYLAMEYIEGRTLTDVLEGEGRFPIDRVVRIAKQIGAALDAAHGLTIVHRDLKPDNIMLTQKGANADFVKVLDFGIAKMTESEDKRNDLTQAGLIIGTPFYMSPEQVSGEKLDARSDIFSFGLIVYEMLSGGLPYSGQNTQAVMVSRLTTTPKPLRHVNPAIPVPVEAAVMHALVRERDARTPIAGQLVTELEAAVEGKAPDVSRGTTTASQPRHDTVPIQAALPTPPGYPPIPIAGPVQPYAGGFGSGPPSPQQGYPPVYPTDRAPSVQPMAPGGYVPTTAEPSPFGAPQPGYAPAPARPYAPAPARKGGAGIGLLLVGLVVLVLVVGVGGVGGYGYYKGWFGGGATTAGPGKDPVPSNPADADAEAERLFQQGYDLQVKGDHAGAAGKYREAIRKKPQNPKVYRNLGAALVDSKQYEEAIKALETAQSQDPAPNDQVLYNLGMAHFKLKNYLKAAEQFQSAGRIGTDPDAHAFAGFAFDNAGNKPSAGDEYRKYLAAAPTGTYADRISDIMAGREKVPTADEFQL